MREFLEMRGGGGGGGGRGGRVLGREFLSGSHGGSGGIRFGKLVGLVVDPGWLEGGRLCHDILVLGVGLLINALWCTCCHIYLGNSGACWCKISDWWGRGRAQHTNHAVSKPSG